MIELKEVRKTYKTKKGVKTLALDKVSFKLPNKGLIFILGKSGSGKSTLLNILGGLDKYDSGDMIVDSKSTKKFKGKDYDYYRNTYVGFIFQEFNLLEEYNVYDNILLSRKLQKEKVSQTVIDDLLNKVGIGDLGKRRMNELSGGQKGRVAIARALIKNPEIILADEPTGNLDEETGKQIFNLLKSISRSKLVVVVSHDRESALKYADGIIEITDGKIISNSIPNLPENPRKFKSKKSKLPLLPSLKFAYLNLQSHKIRLFFTILLVCMSIVFFGTSKILSKFNIEESHSKTMVHDKEDYINLKKGVYNDYDRTWYDGGDHIELEPDDIEYLENEIKSPYAYKYLFNEENDLVGFDINFRGTIKSDTSVYYLMIPQYYTFIEADKSYVTGEIIGKYPEQDDEIMIHSYLADFIMQYGIMVYEENPNQFKKEYYKPTSYEDFMAEDKYFTFGSTKLKVSGIIMDNTMPFLKLKDIPYKEQMGVKETWLGVPSNDNKAYEFRQTIQMTALDIYVKKGFTETIGLKPNTSIDRSYYLVQIKNKDRLEYVGDSYRYLRQTTTAFDGEKQALIPKLNDNEIIVPESYLDNISVKDYSKLKEQYIKNYHEEVRKLEEENRKINEENQKLLDEYYQKMEQGEEVERPILTDEKEIRYLEEDELKLEFLKNYLKENKVVGETVSLVVSKTNGTSREEIENLKIVGIELDGNITYMADNVASKYIRKNYYISDVLIKENNQKELERLFTLFPFDNSKYLTETVYSPNIKSISSALENVAWIAEFASYIFGLFAFILLTNFIVSSIYYNKKTIGILRGLGARKIDAFKIFLNEGLIIGSVSLILAIIILYIAIYVTNAYISSHLFFGIHFITFTPENLILIVGSVLLIIFISSLFTVRRIAKMNPVDAILNK